MSWFYFYECNFGCNLFGLDIGSQVICNFIFLIEIFLVVWGLAIALLIIYRGFKRLILDIAGMGLKGWKDYKVKGEIK